MGLRVIREESRESSIISCERRLCVPAGIVNYFHVFKARNSDSLQLCVLRLRLLQDGDIGVGVFPEGSPVTSR